MNRELKLSRRRPASVPFFAPGEVHNQLSIVTTGGIEVVIQTILLLDGECLIFKGRLAASQDTGKLIFVPYDKIDYIGFNRLVAEEEFRSWFPENPTSETLAAPTPEANVSSKTPIPSRAALLERVRARTNTYGATASTSPSS
jgi:hypothetical protein